MSKTSKKYLLEFKERPLQYFADKALRIYREPLKHFWKTFYHDATIIKLYEAFRKRGDNIGYYSEIYSGEVEFHFTIMVFKIDLNNFTKYVCVLGGIYITKDGIHAAILNNSEEIYNNSSFDIKENLLAVENIINDFLRESELYIKKYILDNKG